MTDNKMCALSFRSLAVFVIVAIAALVLRIWLASLGHNYDIDSFALVARTLLDGKDPYPVTTRWPYGPLLWTPLVWCYQLGLEWIPGNREAFHIVWAAFLSLADVGIAVVLWRLLGIGAGLLYLVHPISFLITGFHSQIENVAIFLALASWIVLTRKQSRKRNLFYGISIVLLSMSILTKHVFLFWPLCILSVRSCGSLQRRLLYVTVTYSLVVIGLLPWLTDPTLRAAFIYDVVQYDPIRFVNATGYPDGLLGTIIAGLFSDLGGGTCAMLAKLLWASVVIGLCLLLGRLKEDVVPVRDIIFYYAVALVALSPTLADQYLVIPVISVVFWRTKGMAWLYSILTIFYLLISYSNVGSVPGLIPIPELLQPFRQREFFSLLLQGLLVAWLVMQLRELKRIYVIQHSDSAA